MPYLVKAAIRTGPHYNPGYFIEATSAERTTKHVFLQSPGPFVRAIIARAHAVDASDVRLAWL